MPAGSEAGGRKFGVVSRDREDLVELVKGALLLWGIEREVHLLSDAVVVGCCSVRCESTPRRWVLSVSGPQEGEIYTFASVLKLLAALRRSL